MPVAEMTPTLSEAFEFDNDEMTEAGMDVHRANHMLRGKPEGRYDLASSNFREVLSTVPTGVVVITAIESSRPVGLVVGTFTSVSLEPPLVGFLPAASSTSFPRVLASKAFCANVLTHDQQDVCRAFAVSGNDKFAGLSWRPSPVSGSPVLDGVAAWIDCSITAVHEAGDHLIVIGAVEHMALSARSPSLVFYRGAYTHPHGTTVDVRPLA